MHNHEASVLVVIPAYSQWEYVCATVESLLRLASGIDCVVYDDASPDAPTPAFMSLLTRYTGRLTFQRFDAQAGMTRSWNHGLALAREAGYQFCCVANSDLLFPLGWERAMLFWLNRELDLVGPCSNAPGHTELQQNVHRFVPDYVLTDDLAAIDAVGQHCLEQWNGTALQAEINGFCLMAKTSTWWNGSYSQSEVFDPAFPMEGNERELQRRWLNAGLKIGVTPGSFVFHYRSVSRGEGKILGVAMRRGVPKQN